MCVKIMKWNKLEMRNMGHVWHDQYIWAKNWLFLAVEGPKIWKLENFEVIKIGHPFNSLKQKTIFDTPIFSSDQK